MKYTQEYYLKNKEKILERSRRRYLEKHDQIMEYEKKRREKHNAYKRKRNIELKKFILKQYGGKCVCCGENRFEFLSIDHINNDGYKHRREFKGNIYLWLVKNNFPKDIVQILCFNCNMSKAFYGYCPHRRRE